MRHDTPGDGELARGTEQLACRSGYCPDERSGGRGVIGAPISKIGPISRLSAQLLRGPLQCLVHTDLSWQLSRLLCARGEWPPCRRPAERCDKLAPRPVLRQLCPHWLQDRSTAAAVASWSRFLDRPTAAPAGDRSGRSRNCHRARRARAALRSRSGCGECRPESVSDCVPAAAPRCRSPRQPRPTFRW